MPQPLREQLRGCSGGAGGPQLHPSYCAHTGLALSPSPAQPSTAQLSAALGDCQGNVPSLLLFPGWDLGAEGWGHSAHALLHDRHRPEHLLQVLCAIQHRGVSATLNLSSDLNSLQLWLGHDASRSWDTLGVTARNSMPEFHA